MLWAAHKNLKGINEIESVTTNCSQWGGKKEWNKTKTSFCWTATIIYHFIKLEYTTEGLNKCFSSLMPRQSKFVLPHNSCMTDRLVFITVSKINYFHEISKSATSIIMGLDIFYKITLLIKLLPTDTSISISWRFMSASNEK